ncbi:MAG: S41 family peptidase [Bacteroidales bacterium]|nr:S41 family peptidase [Bacteroidales bacterium]MCI2121286.1 S41 family peptidase [Bacteroidales bacterium]MCI2145224.1 S41 family peptidase [Bacteroidales bacterium]
MKYLQIVITSAAVAASLGGMNSCNLWNTGNTSQNDSLKHDLAVKKYLKNNYMDVYYYWNDYVPDDVDPSSNGIYDYFDDLLYSKDRWSWMMDKDYYVSMTTGEVTGSFGVSYGQMIDYYDDYDVRVRYVIEGGPMYNAGVRRGWVLDSLGGESMRQSIIDGTYQTLMDTSPQTYTFTDLNGTNHTFTLSAATFNAKSYLKYCLFTDKDFSGLTSPVGYLNYRSFMAQKIDEIGEAMAYFKKADIKDMILDLRYNGGGDGDAAQALADYLAPPSANGEVYAVRSHNKLLSSKGWDSESTIERNDTSLNLDRLYIITTDGTASASEVILNGMKPLMNVTQVGDTTYGKPNGMYVLLYPGTDEELNEIDAGNYSNLEYCFLPICFYTDNKNGVGHYEDGIAPDDLRPDDLYHDFDANEDNIKACLTDIVTGSFPNLPVITSKSSISPFGRKARFNDGSLQPSFGMYMIKPDRKQFETLRK